MSGCTDFRESLLEAAVGELPAERRAALDRHLTGCAGCREEAEVIRSCLARVRQELPAPAAGELDVYAAILPRLDAIDARRLGRRLVSLTYPLVAAVAVLVVALVMVGVHVGFRLAPRPPSSPGSTADADLARLIERSLPIVLAAANSEGEGVLLTGDGSAPVRGLAARLAGEARELETALAARGERRRKRLVADLAEVLEQVAATDGADRAQAWRRVRRTVESRHLLFQVSAETMKGL